MRFLKTVLRGSIVALLVTLIALAQQTNSQTATESAPPPGSSAKRSAAELQKLAEPIALFEDSLIATILPASAYPLEIVQASQFIANPNNIAKIDSQPWDENVKALAHVPGALKKLSDNLQWTIELGEAFVAQDKELMDAIQALRLKAQKAGTLRSTEQQVVIVTNTVVQIVSSNPEVIYVPQYNPAVVYYPPPTYVYDPYAPLITFGAGVAVGVIIANNSCDWNHGGCYHNNVNIDIDRTVNRNTNLNMDRGQKWQPDQNRLRTSGSSKSVRSQEARGWGTGTRPTTGAVGALPSAGSAIARPSTAPAARPPAGPVRTAPYVPPSANRPTVGDGGSPSAASLANRPNATAAIPARPAPSVGSVNNNAFSGVGNGSGARQSSSRGSVSRGGGGGGRGGGGRR